MSPSVISGNKIQIKNFRMFLVIYFELRQYWFNWRKLNRSKVEAATVWFIRYEPYHISYIWFICNNSYRMTEFNWNNLTLTQSFITVENKLVIMIHNILSSKFHFQKWWSGFCFRKTRSVTFPKFQRKKLWPGTQYFCLDFVSVNHTRWRSQIRILKIFLDFVSVKHGGWFPNFWILFPWFANKG